MDIDVENGRVVEVRPCASDPPGPSVEVEVGPGPSSASSMDGHIEHLGGLLLLPSLREHHAHLDKVLTADAIVNRSGDLKGAIDAWIEAEESGLFDREEMQARAETAIEHMLYSGVTSVRTHVNIGASDQEFRNLRAVRAACERFRGLVDIEIVALTQSPLAGPEGRDNRLVLDRAIELGIDLIGGCPHLEARPHEMISHVLDIAEAADLDIDLHVDESLDPEMSTVETLATEVVNRGIQRRITASHCVGLSVQTEARQAAIASLLHEAQIAVVALPQTNLFLQGRDHPQSMPRGIAPVKLLSDHGVSVEAGGDNVQDPFNPMGRFDPLETAALLVLAAHVDPDQALRAVTTNSLLLENPLQDLIGVPADFLAIEASNIREALATATASRRTLRGGRVVAMTTLERRSIPLRSKPRV